MEATNYNSNATFNDGTCVYDNVIPGCMDINATNYTPEATVDNGSCTYPPVPEEIVGCMEI